MDAVRMRLEGSAAVLELARPGTGNALETAVVEGLSRALADATEAGARAVVLVGEGRNFCSGANLADLAALADADFEARLADAERLGGLYLALLRSPLLTLAAVRGAAYGGGLGLACACDVVVAAPDARLQFSEVRLGFVPALISVFLPRRLPAARLALLFLEPFPLAAEGGLAAGLVDEVASDPLARALERAATFARTASPAAVAATKRLLLGHALPDLEFRLAAAARLNAEQRAHAECRRGVAHFLATRGFPDWTA